MTTIDREHLRKLADAATPGPWDYPGELLGLPCSTVFAGDPERMHAAYVAAMGTQDGRFIAAARTAVPELLDALDAAEARVQRVRELHEHRAPEPPYVEYCEHCGADWPCETVRALDT